MPFDVRCSVALQPTLVRSAVALATTAWVLAAVTALASAAALAKISDDESAAGSQAEPHGDARRQALDAALRTRVEAGFRGVVLVAEGNEILLHEGYGRLDPEKPGEMPRDAVFTLGSIAKPFTALLVLQLEEEGLLAVDDPIVRHLPEVPADKRAITLHHLLTHTSGLPAALGEDFDFVDRDTLVSLALEAPLGFAPGTRYEYSNVGYSLLAAIVERTTDRPFAEVLRRRVFGPAGMDETGFDPSLWPAERLAQGSRDGERWGSVVERYDSRGPSWHLLGNGGLHSTATDMLRFHRALDDDRLLSPAAKAKAFFRQMPEDEAGTSHYGYGWTIYDTANGGTLLAHNGGNRIFFADFQRYVDDDRMVFLAAAQPMRGLSRLGEDIARQLENPSRVNEPPAPRIALLIGAPEPHGDVVLSDRPPSTHLVASPLGTPTGRLLDALRIPAAQRQVEGLFAQSLIDPLVPEGPTALLDRLAADLGDFGLDAAEQVGDDRVEVILSPAGQEVRLLLILHFEAGEPARIRGIDVEGID